MNILLTILVLGIIAALSVFAAHLMLPYPSSEWHAGEFQPKPRVECECEDCMEPGLRGPSRTSLD
jgi:hypothetical protein